MSEEFKKAKQIRIGTGAGYAGDRIEPAIELARDGDLDYLVFECLAERTIALAQQERLAFPDCGYTPLLGPRMRGVLPYMFNQDGKPRFRIITNMGASNPQAAACLVAHIAQELGLPPVRIATVLGDDVYSHVKSDSTNMLDIGIAPAALGDSLISANAYLGADGIVQALEQGADIVITGRVADPSLFVAPQVFEFGHAWDDWDVLGKDRKSTRLNSSHVSISYAVLCLEKKIQNWVAKEFQKHAVLDSDGEDVLLSYN